MCGSRDRHHSLHLDFVEDALQVCRTECGGNADFDGNPDTDYDKYTYAESYGNTDTESESVTESHAHIDIASHAGSEAGKHERTFL